VPAGGGKAPSALVPTAVCERAAASLSRRARSSGAARDNLPDAVRAGPFHAYARMDGLAPHGATGARALAYSDGNPWQESGLALDSGAAVDHQGAGHPVVLGGGPADRGTVGLAYRNPRRREHTLRLAGEAGLSLGRSRGAAAPAPATSPDSGALQNADPGPRA
jgi:hypothetical protein